MATTGAIYDAGTGGKLRKRPLRRPTLTPYDRPLSAARGLRVLPGSAVEKKNFLSKLVDPASRIISRSASRLFFSVFRKRLDAPLAAPEEDLQSSEEVNAAVYTNPPLGVQENRGSDAENTINSSSIDGVQQNRDSATEGIFELEQLLKKKTFTRVEFDRLTELLRSRTIGSSRLQSAIRCEKTERANVLGKENGIGCIESNGNISNPAVKETMPEKDYASPAELAKSYMGYRPLKVPSSALSFRNQIYREDTALPNNVSNGKNGSNLSTVPQSVVCFNGIPEALENGHVTPRPLGRSAMHRLSCSPYFKAPSSTNIKGGEPYRDVYAGPSTSSPWTPTNFMQSSGKQVRKRRNSILDGDFGSSGPIRRIRQKSNLMSPYKDSYLLLTGNVPPISSTLLAENINQQSATSIQEPLSLDGPKDSTRNLRHVENGDNKVPSTSAATIPPQASEMKRKTLQALDKLVTSPKERLSELRAIARDGLPSKLTVNMLHERALKSMEDIDSSKFFNLQDPSNLDAPSDSDAPKPTSSISQDQLTVEHNAPPKPAFSGIKMAIETVRMVNTVTSVTDAKPGLKTVDFAISGSVAVPSPKKPAFQMTAPEDFLELDDDDDDDDAYNNRDASEPFATGNDKPEPKISECKTAIFERAISEKSLGCSSESMLTSGSILNKEAGIIASNRPVNEKDTGFSLHVPPASSTSPPSSMPSPLLDKSALQKEQFAASGFIFGSKESHASVLPTTTTGIRDSTGLTFNQSNATTTTLSEGLDSDKGGKRSKCGDLFKSSGNAASASISTLNSPAFASFGACTTSSLSNGLQTSISSTYSVSTAAAAAMPFSNNSASSTLSISAASTTSSSSPSISSAPIFSTVTSGASTGAPISVSPSKGKSISRELEGMPVKASTFSTSSAIASGTPTAFSNTGSNSSVLATPFMSSSTSFSVAASSSFSSSGSSSLALSAPSTFSNTGSSIFGFIAPSQSSSSSLSVANSSSQNSTTTFGATAGTTFGSDIIQAGNGISQFSQDTASQFGSFSSSPTFGLSGSSSLGSGSSHFGPVTSEFIPFGSSSGLSPPTVVGSSTSGSSSSLAPIATASLPGPSSQIFTSTVIGSSTSLSKGFSFGQSASSSSSQPSTSIFVSSTSLPSTGFSFGQSASTSSSQSSSSSVFGSSTSSPSTGFSLGQSAPISSSQPSSSSVFGSSTSSSTGFSIGQSAPMSSSQPSSSSPFGSTTSPSTGFSFGQLPPISTAPPSTTAMGFSFGQSAPSGSSSFIFSALPGSTFSFTSAGTITSSALFSPAQPAFGLPTPAAGFSSASTGNDQMNVEDSMADDTVQAAAHMVSSFGQAANSLPTSNFTFGSPAVPSGGPSLVQFGSQQNSSVTQSPSPFQTGGNLEFSAGGSFSLGSAGGDKSGRKMVKINRNRHRKK